MLLLVGTVRPENAFVATLGRTGPRAYAQNFTRFVTSAVSPRVSVLHWQVSRCGPLEISMNDPSRDGAIDVLLAGLVLHPRLELHAPQLIIHARGAASTLPLIIAVLGYVIVIVRRRELVAMHVRAVARARVVDQGFGQLVAFADVLPLSSCQSRCTIGRPPPKGCAGALMSSCRPP